MSAHTGFLSFASDRLIFIVDTDGARIVDTDGAFLTDLPRGDNWRAKFRKKDASARPVITRYDNGI
jgi:hypothetical protein